MRLGSDLGQRVRPPGSAPVVGASREAMHVGRGTRQAAQQQPGSSTCRRCHPEARLLHDSEAALHPAKMRCASHQVSRVTLSGQHFSAESRDACQAAGLQIKSNKAHTGCH